MKATIEKWKLYGKEQGKEQECPVLVLDASKNELDATEALYRLHDICKGLKGKGLNNSLATISNPDTKAWSTNFTIDLGTLLAMVADITSNTLKKEFAVAWLKSLAQSHRDRSSGKIAEELRCRCGLTFKREKQARAHRKKCSVIAADMPLLRRVLKDLKNLSGKKASNGNVKGKASKLQKTKSRKVHAQTPDRPKDKKANKRKVYTRRQTRRT